MTVRPESGTLPHYPTPKTWSVLEDAATGEVILVEYTSIDDVTHRPVYTPVTPQAAANLLLRLRERARIAENRAYQLQYKESAKVLDLYRQLSRTQEEVAWRDREIQRLVQENARYYAEVCELDDETQAELSHILTSAMNEGVKSSVVRFEQAPVSSIFPAHETI